MLQTLSCDDAQGYYMSPPLDAQALASWMSERHAASASGCGFATA